MVLAPFLWINFYITSYKYDNIWDKCAFQHCRSKLNVTDAIVGVYEGTSVRVYPTE